MDTAVRVIPDDHPVRRYMRFGRFVWMIQQKALWLSRIDKLGDEWELTLAGRQLAHVIATAPITPLDQLPPTETTIERVQRITKSWRQSTFVNCWNAAAFESYANVEGVLPLG